MSHLIPCPVCGGQLHHRRWPYLEGAGSTPLMVDCDLRHAALTEPHIWEELRLQTWIADALDMLDAMPHDDPPPAPTSTA